MKKIEKKQKKFDRSGKITNKLSLNGNIPHFSSKNNKLFDYNENESNCILYSNINCENSDMEDNFKRTTIMPCMSSNDINQNILKFNKIKIKSINEANINQWKAVLYNHNRTFSITQLNEGIYYNDDSKIFNQNDKNSFKEFDEMDIISKDSIRTRCLETRLIKDYIKNLEALLRFFIKENKLKYKQGLNEIAGAFLLLKYSNIKIMTFSEVYNLLNGFFHLFLFNYYDDKTIFSLRNSLSLLQLLLKYHSPDIYNAFEKSMLFPEVYGTSWILTAFSYKLNLNKLFYLWNKLILENDQLMIHYFFAALLIYKKNSYINLDDYSLPFALTKINIGSEKEIDIIYNNALNMRNQTPYSFRYFAFQLDILKHKSNHHKIKYDYYHPDILISLPIFPAEICFICYKNIIKCPDENHISINTFNCEHCSMGIKKTINYILFDIRTSELNNSKNGFLEKFDPIDQKYLKDKNLLNIIKEKLDNAKDNNHFIFINSKSRNVMDFNSNFNTKKLKPKRNKTAKNVEIEEIQKKKKLSLKEKNYEKEEELLKNIVLFLIKNNYKYISYAYGGFETLHNEIFQNKAYSNVKILNHIEEKCEICKNNNKILKEKRRQSCQVNLNKFSLFSKIPKKTPNTIKKNEIKNINESYKIVTINEVNQMISNTDYFAGPCCFIFDSKLNGENSENQGLLIIYDKKIYCIKTPTHNNKPMQIIQEIFLTKIKDCKIKTKIFCYIYFINDNQKEENIIIKFNSEMELNNFIDSFQKAKKEA